ncbi:MAG: DUF192 domain-containing protein [Gemmatimonadota bacterium]
MTKIRCAPSLLLLAALAVFASGCERDEPVAGVVDAPVEFGAGTVVIETDDVSFTLGVEVAESEAQRSRGLMQRTSLDPDSGMIFLFDSEQPPENTFWMYNTLIPLDIAFIGSDGRIGSIREMEPCTSPYPQWCQYYEAGVPFESALEVNAGYFEEHGIGVGDPVSLTTE